MHLSLVAYNGMADRLNNIKSWSVFNACHWSTDHPGDYYYLSKSISAEVVRSWGSCSQGSLPLNWMNFSEISLTALNQPPPHFWNTKHFTTEVFRLGISGACKHHTISHTQSSIIMYVHCTIVLSPPLFFQEFRWQPPAR